MTEPAAPVPDRAAAIANAAWLNLLTKAKQGKTLSAADWRELRRLASEAGLVQPLPWLHDQMQALAQALGVSVRSLETWRARGAPVPTAGPFDELAVRLWHCAQPTRGKRALAAPSAALVVYLDQVKPAAKAAPAKAKADPAALVKRRQAERLDLQNARLRDTLRHQAQDHFRSLVGRVEQLLLRDLCGGTLARLWETCQQPRAAAEGALARDLRCRIEATLAQALGSTHADPT